MTPDEDAFLHDLVVLRRGRALRGPYLRGRVGPQLSLVSGVQSTDTDPELRQKVAATLRRLMAGLPPDLQSAINAAFAVDERYVHRQLSDRIALLADEQHIALRTARRRVEHACAMVAQAASGLSLRMEKPASPEEGWRVHSLNALLRLDSPRPELHEQRMVVAEQDNLSEIAVRFSLPRQFGDRSSTHALYYDLLYGGIIRDVEVLGEGEHYRFTLELPSVLRHGDTHEYGMLFRIPYGQAMRPHYAFVPLVPCTSFTLRVRFPLDRQPEAVWRLDRVPPRLLDDDRPGVDILFPDPAGEVSLAFRELRPGYGYGIAWMPLDEP